MLATAQKCMETPGTADAATAGRRPDVGAHQQLPDIPRVRTSPKLDCKLALSLAKLDCNQVQSGVAQDCTRRSPAHVLVLASHGGSVPLLAPELCMQSSAIQTRNPACALTTRPPMLQRQMRSPSSKASHTSEASRQRLWSSHRWPGTAKRAEASGRQHHCQRCLAGKVLAWSALSDTKATVQGVCALLYLNAVQQPGQPSLAGCWAVNRCCRAGQR